MAKPVDDLLTTRQLQDLLQVDRITIYRMLKDGRLRGFKVGGQWRFSRREIEAWLRDQRVRLALGPAPVLSGESLAQTAQVLPISCIRAIQGVCAEAMDVAMVTIGMDGTPLCSISNSCDFCDLVLSTQTGRQRCARSWMQQSDGEIHPCHAGLLCVSATVATGEQPVALAAACQFTILGARSAEPTWQPNISELATDLGLAENELRAAMNTVRSTPASQIPRISRLARQVAETFSEIGQERLNLLSRLEQIAAMSKL